MIWERIFYLSILIAFIAFIFLKDKGFSTKNSAIISLFSPVVGGLFLIFGTMFALFFGAAILFSGVMYLVNKKKIDSFRKNFQVRVYKV
jgi:hypothetical protein